MKKILIITNSGVGLYSFRRELLEKLIKEKYQVILAYADGMRHKEFTDIGCSCIHLEFDSSSMNPLKDIKMFLGCIRVLGCVKPDFVLLYTVKPCIYGGLACALYDIPSIATVTGVSTALLTENKTVSVIATMLCRIGYSRSKTLFFQNSNNEELFRRKKIAGKKHILVKGSGVNLAAHPYREYPENDGKIKILYLGRFLKVKGLEEFAYAMRKAQSENPDIICRIVGEPCDQLPVLEEAVEDGIIERYGPVDDVNPYLAWCDVLVMPSYAEGMSNVMLEAAATGRAALASDVPGCREIVEEGKTGLLFEPRNGEKIYQAIMDFAAIPYEERKQMGIRANEKMKREFDRIKVVDCYMKEIRDNLKKG